ncbi:MAG: PEP-CTERM sorting domain-containing protein [Nitrospira sp.]|nr:PEP-CTERM sorting domain-containing protein [Nitrospira sp.]
MYKSRKRLFFIASFISTIFLIWGQISQAQTIFYDDFNGIGLDETKWDVNVKGGTYRVSDGALSLYSSEYSSTGDGFPAVLTKYNPFTEDQDWTLTTMMRFIAGPNIYGDGVALYKGSSREKIAYIYQSRRQGEFNIWDEREGILKCIWNGDTLSDTHTFAIQREGDYYLGFVDGEFAGSAYNQSNPGRLVLGNDDVGRLYGSWNPVSIGYVDISIKDPAPVSATLITTSPVPEPGTLLLTLTGITSVMLHLILSLRKHGIGSVA